MKIEKPDWLLQTEGILETLNEGVLILDDCQRFVFANQRMGEMTGFKREEVLGREVAEFYPAEAMAFLKQKVSQTTADGQNRYEFFVPKKDGGQVPVVLSEQLRAGVPEPLLSQALHAIDEALRRAGGNKSRAAKELGISRFALQRKLEKYGMEPGAGEGAPAQDEA